MRKRCRFICRCVFVLYKRHHWSLARCFVRRWFVIGQVVCPSYRLLHSLRCDLFHCPPWTDGHGRTLCCCRTGVERSVVRWSDRETERGREWLGVWVWFCGWVDVRVYTFLVLRGWFARGWIARKVCTEWNRREWSFLFRPRYGQNTVRMFALCLVMSSYVSSDQER